ncbi:flagellar hook-length control protein FliK [Paenibacillus alkaliterrae]|uniref:flagellar hook-length control protein FliK n=1 Tax=Paenibacillus alkaliterrae TaxID=320909 RepID=UPI001F2E4BDC|nr:flagellar hook-length control protein FliK [Paenibacillus alkaliterrae]MCF2937009.1 flagellar hook-length control protein FliK [Paenibacillus alkaliterrae]
MEMMIPQIVASQPQAQAASNSNAGKGASGAGFQKTLFQQIISGTAGTPSAVQPVQLVANVMNTEVLAVDENLAEASLSDMLAIIDGLIDQLEAPVTEDSEKVLEVEEQIRQLETALEQMTALLALIGMPAALIQSLVPATDLSQRAQEVNPNTVQASALKDSLQDSLLQLQAVLQQGSMKRVQQQEPVAFVGQQLQALTAILEGDPVDMKKMQTKSDAFTQQLFIAQSAPQAEVNTLLKRLSQQAVHPSYLASNIQTNEPSVHNEAAGSALESINPFQLGANSSENLRGLTPVAVNAAAATSFVAADEFAQSMTGLIVQKFELTTLNGVSEAKLMLFPEHLGQVDVRITMQNGLLTAIFQTDTAMAKDMLDNQMAQLRLALQAQGLTVDKLEVSQGQPSAQLSHQQHGQGGNQQQASSRSSFKGENGSNETQIEADMVEQAAVQGLGYGRAINVKA